MFRTRMILLRMRSWIQSEVLERFRIQAYQEDFASKTNRWEKVPYVGFRMILLRIRVQKNTINMDP
jgi:hypothetical protein